MKKSLIETVITGEQSPKRTKSKVEFLALREEISEALEKGW
ncbi:protein TraK [Legionella sainthelensi]|nr:protein TraK [Legionella sainthelensi]